VGIFSKNDIQAVWGAMKPDIVTTRLFFDPLAIPLTILFSKTRWISANLVTFSALLPGLAGALFFYSGSFGLGALGYYVFFLLDTVDGKLARLQGGGCVLGAFYDFIVDRIVIGLMLIGMSCAFIRDGYWVGFLMTQLFLLMFFLKDVFDLKWKESGVDTTPSGAGGRGSNGLQTKWKIHFKPGQLLSCFIMFIIAPLSHAYVLSFSLAIVCVVFSMGSNVVFPWLKYLKTKS
jgi:phosphatidylglycerophosphate synthase